MNKNTTQKALHTASKKRSKRDEESEFEIEEVIRGDDFELKKEKKIPNWLAKRRHSNTYNGSFIVLGVTGSGKTTMINYITAKDQRDIEGDDMGVSVMSKTTKIAIKESEFTTKGQKYNLRFIDTIGFDAVDMDPRVLIQDLMKEVIIHNVQSMNGVILLIKMERNRYHIMQQIDKVLLFFNKFKALKEHVLVVITHSAMYTQDLQEDYSMQIYEAFQKYCNPENICHINLAKTVEMKEPFKSIFEELIDPEVDKLLNKLKDMRSSFTPMSYIAEKINLNDMVKQDLN
jgi:GTPase Era involved in 16S rRNA processing